MSPSAPVSLEDQFLSVLARPHGADAVVAVPSFTPRKPRVERQQQQQPSETQPLRRAPPPTPRAGLREESLHTLPDLALRSGTFGGGGGGGSSRAEERRSGAGVAYGLVLAASARATFSAASSAAAAAAAAAAMAAVPGAGASAGGGASAAAVWENLSERALRERRCWLALVPRARQRVWPPRWLEDAEGRDIAAGPAAAATAVCDLVDSDAGVAAAPDAAAAIAPSDTTTWLSLQPFGDMSAGRTGGRRGGGGGARLPALVETKALFDPPPPVCERTREPEA